MAEAASPTAGAASPTAGAASPTAEAASSTAEGAENADDGEATGNYDCNICLDKAKDSVVTYCGHLFCWPCLHQWMSTRPDRQMCPVCKAGISKDKVVPIYGRGNTNSTDPREKLPPRPAAQRSEPESAGQFGDFSIGNLQMSFGIGAFPFSIFATAINNRNANRPANPAAGTQQHAEEQVLSRIFLFVAVFFAIWLIIA